MGHLFTSCESRFGMIRVDERVLGSSSLGKVCLASPGSWTGSRMDQYHISVFRNLMARCKELDFVDGYYTVGMRPFERCTGIYGLSARR